MVGLLLLQLDSTHPSLVAWLDYAKTMLVLLGICLVALILSRVVFPKLSIKRNESSSPLTIVASVTLEPRKTLYLVKANKTVVLLASSSEGIHYMTTIGSGDLEDTGEDAPALQTDPPTLVRFPRAKAMFGRKQVNVSS